METTMIVALIALMVSVVTTSLAVYLYRKVKRLPKMHYDKEDGCWVLDDCVRIIDYIHFNCGDYRIYLNYKNKKKGE
jgi:hypothetical protein